MNYENLGLLKPVGGEADKDCAKNSKSAGEMQGEKGDLGFAD